MVADTHAELMEMVDIIGVDRRWLQNPGTVGEHFDIAQGKKKLAIAAGAVQISMSDLAAMCLDRRHRQEEYSVPMQTFQLSHRQPYWTIRPYFDLGSSPWDHPSNACNVPGYGRRSSPPPESMRRLNLLSPQ